MNKKELALKTATFFFARVWGRAQGLILFSALAMPFFTAAIQLHYNLAPRHFAVVTMAWVWLAITTFFIFSFAAEIFLLPRLRTKLLKHVNTELEKISFEKNPTITIEKAIGLLNDIYILLPRPKETYGQRGAFYKEKDALKKLKGIIIATVYCLVYGYWELQENEKAKKHFTAFFSEYLAKSKEPELNAFQNELYVEANKNAEALLAIKKTIAARNKGKRKLTETMQELTRKFLEFAKSRKLALTGIAIIIYALKFFNEELIRFLTIILGILLIFPESKNIIDSVAAFFQWGKKPPQ